MNFTFTDILGLAAAFVVFAALIIIMINVVRSKNKTFLMKTIYGLVLEAEKYIPVPKAGAMRYAYVVDKIVKVIPPKFRRFITAQQLNDMIEGAVIFMKQQLKQIEKAEQEQNIDNNIDKLDEAD